MERSTIERLKALFGKSFLGYEELRPFLERIGYQGACEIPAINYPLEDLEKYAQDYILVLGIPGITIRSLREVFGIDPDVSDPCFYNQDWYMQESFIDTSLETKWYLLKKEVVNESRAVMPDTLIARHYAFPSAILCAYTFFAYYCKNNDHLWWHDFVWCSDTDHNGDRIYVGKYHDVDGVNKNGFSIHRHLALRDCYAAINVI